MLLLLLLYALYIHKKRKSKPHTHSALLCSTAYYYYTQYSCILFRVLGFLLQRLLPPPKAVLPTGYKAAGKKKKIRELLEAAEVEY